MSGPAYSRLQVDERYRQLLRTGTALFAEHSFEEVSMRQIAEAAGISKALLYHYFPSKIELFKAAVAEPAAELAGLIEAGGEGSPAEQLAHILDGYLAWIEAHDRAWTKLLQSAATLPEARELVDGFRARTLAQIATRLTGRAEAPPALRNALTGWLGHVDAAILDWVRRRDLTREQLRDLLLAAFGGAVLAAQQCDPRIELRLT